MQSIMNSSLDLQTKDNSTSGEHGQPRIPFIWQLFAANVITLVSSLFGNSVIIHIIRTDNSMKTTTNHLILNQAWADILTTSFEVVNFFFFSIRSMWPGGLLGVITCKLFKASLFILPVFSVWILVTIAVDRFYAVTRPFRVSPLSRHFKKTILLLWVWSIASSTNTLVQTTLETNNAYHYCKLTTLVANQNDRGWKVFLLADLSLNLFLPFLIIIVPYTFVCLKLWSRDVPGEEANQNERRAEAIKTAKKVTRMMIVVVVLYLLCWLPFCIMISMSLIRFGYVKIKTDLYLFIISITVAFSGLNPYVYLTFNQKFRNGLKHLFGNCLRRAHDFLPSRSHSVELEQI